MISDIKLVRQGKVRRAKLYYLRDRVGKSARIKEKIIRGAKKVKKAAQKAPATSPAALVEDIKQSAQSV